MRRARVLHSLERRAQDARVCGELRNSERGLFRAWRRIVATRYRSDKGEERLRSSHCIYGDCSAQDVFDGGTQGGVAARQLLQLPTRN